jgi:hypothetical protein
MSIRAKLKDSDVKGMLLLAGVCLKYANPRVGLSMEPEGSFICDQLMDGPKGISFRGERGIDLMNLATRHLVLSNIGARIISLFDLNIELEYKDNNYKIYEYNYEEIPHLFISRFHDTTHTDCPFTSYQICRIENLVTKRIERGLVTHVHSHSPLFFDEKSGWWGEEFSSLLINNTVTCNTK